MIDKSNKGEMPKKHVPRILLLTGTAPGTQNVGGIYLRDLCMYYPKDSICCFSVWSTDWGLPVELDWLPIIYGRPPKEKIGRFGQRVAHFSAPFVNGYTKNFNIPSLVSQAVEFGKSNGVNMLWSVLNRPALIYMASKIAAKLDIPIITHVWDIPEILASLRNFDRLSYYSLMRAFAKDQRMATRCAVVSESMKEEYEKKYGIECVILRHGIHQNIRKSPAKALNEDGKFIIGFAGSVYAIKEWQALVSALSKLNWQIGGREIVIRLLTSRIDLKHNSKACIEYLGWRSVEETVEILSNTDITYLPYWFDKSYELEVRMAFPTKMTTYLTAGRPVMFHGPEDSSPTRFFQRFPIGVCCHSLNEDDIIKSLRRFIDDKEFYASAAQASQNAVDEELNLRVFRQRFAELIGIDPNQLLPL